MADRAYARIVAFSALLVLVLGALRPCPLAAQADFEPSNDAWNGYGSFIRIARAGGRTVVSAPLDLDRVRPEDAIVLVGPAQAPPIAELARFVDAGGRLAILDDFGASTELLSRFGIARESAPTAGVPHVRGQDGLLVARPLYRHPLTDGVSAVITNRPAVVRHAALEPLIGFVDQRAGIVLTGVVGRGRLVVVSDPSVFIDLMIPLRGNQKLAENLFSVLRSPTGAVYIVSPSTEITGEFDPAASAPWPERAETFLARIAALDLPADALRIAAGTVLALLALFGWAATAHRDPYVFGFELGRMGKTARTNRLDAATSLHDELTSELARRLSTKPELLIEDLPRTLSAAGIAPAAAKDWTQLMRELRHIYVETQLGRTPRVTEAALERLHARTRPVFEWLGRRA